ncbi:IS5-like element ISBco3 family transposase [Heyndrickxia coagulans]|uniref:IS5-like element ISBco3 family transposase n=1 Tax=Heyndrickxia coagulans TaxID=1398 RepID=UPI0014596897|nr:IS5-like element ISBco3 family transposase [Heyndrickxia coagulans]NMH84033.1 IS5 family transposase [Heyndrickxia coagulans]
MYKKTEHQLTFVEDFFLPFGGKLNKENRWVRLAELIPWWKAEEKYAKSFKKKFKGEKAYSVRIALGALYIKERLGLSDRETVEQITENPYLQYFIGLPEFQEKAPFDHSLMTRFRKRLGANIINELNEWIVLEEQKRQLEEASKENDNNDDHHDDDDHSSGDHQPSGPASEENSTGSASPKTKNKGKLILDATCAPADIAYPTDLGLLNEAREKLEHIIDVLHEPHKGKLRKPRTYRKRARRDYLSVAKQRKAGARKIRKAVGKQLGYVKRNLEIIGNLISQSSLSLLSKDEYRQLLVIHELYRQQAEMYKKKTHRIDHRIVSISQPHVRPIVRGKAKANVEFGSKVAISVVDGYALIEQLDWENYNEGITLRESIENYYNRFGFYPEAILADKIYRNRDNLAYCKSLGIRLSGPRLGRPSKTEDKTLERVARQDASERNAVESKFGEGKRKYGLGLIRARLQETSETVVALQFLIMNLERKLRVLFLKFLYNTILYFNNRNLACI